MKKTFGSHIYRAKSVANTMIWARELLPEAPDGALFIADTIEAAQGRQGRSWTLKPGQLCITAALKPALLQTTDKEHIGLQLNQLSIALSLGILEPLVEYGVGIKWPNDFYYQTKKVGGMLMHPVWEGERLLGVILGFALNVTTEFSSDDQLFSLATSIQMASGKQIEMRPLFYSLLTSLDGYYNLWMTGQNKHIYTTWRKSLLFMGQEIVVHDQGGKAFHARLQQVMPNGDAIIATATHPYQRLPFHLVENIELING